MSITKKIDNNILLGHEYKDLASRLKSTDVNIINPRTLPLSNRFDVIIKYNLVYDLIINGHMDYSLEAYKLHILSFTYGSFKEPYGQKYSFSDYLHSFIDMIRDFQLNGFNEEISLIPIGNDNFILDGSHRLALALVLKENIHAVFLNIQSQNYGYEFFYKRGMKDSLLDFSLLDFINKNMDVRVAIIWPKAEESDSYREGERYLNSKLDVLCYKSISSDYLSLLHITLHCYYHQEFIGNSRNNFKGAHQKVHSVHNKSAKVKIIFFYSDSDSSLIQIKENFRRILGINHSSIHISDGYSDTKLISKLILSHSTFNSFFSQKIELSKYSLSKLEDFDKFLTSAKLDKDCLLLTGSFILEIYGLRSANDIDFLYDGELDGNTYEFSHNKYEKLYPYSIHEMIENPELHFYYLGYKFTKLDIVIDFKRNRAELKDKIDIEHFNRLKDSYKSKLISNQIAKSRYITSKIRHNSYMTIIGLLKKIKLYSLLKKLKDNYKDKCK